MLGLLTAIEGSFSKALEVAQELVDGESAPLFSFYQHLDLLDSVDEPEILVNEVQTKIPSPYYLNRGFSPEFLTLFKVGDCYRTNRALFPVLANIGHGVVGFVGRSLGEELPKWLNSPPSFKTGNYLYGLWLARAKIVETQTAILLEGQGDVIRMHEAGHLNAVGMFKKDLSFGQAQLLERLGVLNLVILTDNDDAGHKGYESIKKKYGNRFNLRRPSFSAKDIGDLSVTEIINLNL